MSKNKNMFLSILLLFLTIIHASILFVLFRLSNNVLLPNKEEKTNFCKNEVKCKKKKEFELVKQIIHLDKFDLNFKTPYEGYLYVFAKSAELKFSDDSTIKIKNKLEGFYLAEGEIIRLTNPVELKSVRFVKR